MTNDRTNYPAEIHSFVANWETVRFATKTRCHKIAELGIYKGATSLELAKLVQEQGYLHLYDYEDRVDEVMDKMAQAGYRNIAGHKASYKLLDSYCWNLALMLGHNPRGAVYDYVFIDGAHTWAIDGFATLLIDRLLMVGGYIDFDDHHWTLAGSPTLGPEVFPLTGQLYTEEQQHAAQVQMIIDLLIRPDPRYKEIVTNKIYRKVAK